MEKQRSKSGPGVSVTLSAGAWLAAGALLMTTAYAQGPMGAKINVTPLASYTGSSPLPKPEKILVYDFAINPDDIQVDKMQAMRPRHLITGDQKPDAIAASASKKYSQELVKALAKTGIPVEHVAKDTPPSDNALMVQGSFTSVKEGNKTERDTIGMGAGGADVQTKVDVHMKTPADSVMFSQFTTDTKAAKNMGSAVPVAAGLNPAAAVAKSTVGDRRKNVNAYASKTADATAKEIIKSMAAQGWVKTNDKGELIADAAK
ncbi:MAG: hypothetical protein QOI94_3173 [Acidobacteriaceae bacterium]|jgi:hypothetical protein|nr:hypothetical protein [Acidobacteriaceae bacterium]